jgi:hypothetical protein
MFGGNAFAGPYYGQAFSFAGELVVVVQRPEVLELFGSYSGPVALVASASGALRLVSAVSEDLDLLGSIDNG